jgi:hypothetical protein
VLALAGGFGGMIGMLQSLRIFGAFIARPRSSDRSDEPIRGEIYSAERLELYAESLAARQPPRHPPGRLPKSWGSSS